MVMGPIIVLSVSAYSGADIKNKMVLFKNTLQNFAGIYG